MKTNKALLFFFIVYSLITIYFIYDIQRDQSASLGYVFIFPVFWILAGIALGLLFWIKKIKLKSATDVFLLIFSTPIPLLLIFFIHSSLPSSSLITSSFEYNKKGHRHREVRYDYSSGGQTQRTEYYVSKDFVTDSEYFPKNDVWLKDSIWTYYNKDGTIEKTEDYSH